MKLLTVEQSRELDNTAINKMGIPGIDLMGSAGTIVAEYALNMIAHITEPKIAIVCGKGNNAGDGYKAALDLTDKGFSPVVFTIFEESSIAGDAKYYFDKCVKNKIVINDISDFYDEQYDLIIDAILGTGFSGELKQPLLEITKQINDNNALILAIDIPSGVDARNGFVSENAVKADLTVTMGYSKVGMMIQPAHLHCGEIVIADIGFPNIYNDMGGSKYRTNNEEFAYEYLSAPKVDTYKQKEGKVLIIAGSRGMTGAAILATKGAIRSGAGLVITVAPKSISDIYETNIIEGLTVATEDKERGYLTEKNYEDIEKYFSWADALLIGPGLGNHDPTLALVKKVISTFEKPVIIDADALNVFIDNLELLNKINSDFIITPHFGEFSRLLKTQMIKVKKNVLEELEKFSNKYKGTLVAKNAPTFIANKNEIILNTTGNQGMATGGTGDVLSGIIASLLSQGIPTTIAAELGVFIHGKAADLANVQKGFRGLIASDIIGYLPQALKDYE